MTRNGSHAGAERELPPDVQKIITQLIASGDKYAFHAHAGVLMKLPDKALDGVFAAIKDSVGVGRAEFDSVIRQLREDTREQSHNGLRIIQVNNRSLNEATADALKELEAANDPPIVFQRGNTIVAVQRDESGHALLARYDSLALRSRLARVAAFAEYNGVGGRRLCSPPMDVVADILNCGETSFPILNGITNVPPIKSDGSIRTEAGYDPTTKLYFQPEAGFKLVSIPDNPVRADAQKAAQLVADELLHEFPFATEADRANAFGAMLTPLLRQALDIKPPMFAFDAPSPGSGKSLLAAAIATVATGERPAMAVLPETEAEVRKSITALLDAGARVVIYDNVGRTVRSSSLSSAVTCNFWEDRVLGRTEKIKVPQQAVWFMTGNNLSFSREIARRVCRIKIDAKMSHPETRTGFKRKDDELLEWVRAERGAIVGALLTMVRAWISAGRPKSSVPSIGSFDVWAQTIGGVLEFAGVKGLLSNLTDLRAEADEESNEWEPFLTLWAMKFGNSDVSASSIVDFFLHLNSHLLPDEVGDAESKTLAKRLGKLLAKKVGTRFGERQLHVERGKPNDHTHIGTWRVEGDLDGLHCGVSCGVAGKETTTVKDWK